MASSEIIGNKCCIFDGLYPNIKIIFEWLLTNRIRRITDTSVYEKQSTLDTNKQSTTLSTTDGGSAYMYQALNGIPMSCTYESLSEI